MGKANEDRIFFGKYCQSDETWAYNEPESKQKLDAVAEKSTAAPVKLGDTVSGKLIVYCFLILTGKY